MMKHEKVRERVLEDVDPTLKKKKKKRKRKTALMTALQFVIVIVVVFVLFYILFGISTVKGNSMYPSLHAGDRVIYTHMNREYQKGDVVAVKMDDGSIYVKRIAAVPGDTVSIQRGVFYVNGNAFEVESSIGKTEAKEGIEYPYTVQDNQYFVLGDNRTVSDDSRSFGTIGKDQLKGKIRWFFGGVK